MLRKFKRKSPHIFLFIGVSLFIPLLGAYASFDSLREADFLFPGIKFEQSDIPDLLADKQGVFQVAPLLGACLARLESCRQLSVGYSLQAIHLLRDPFSIRC
jgi:hypothetical protein